MWLVFLLGLSDMCYFWATSCDCWLEIFLTAPGPSFLQAQWSDNFLDGDSSVGFSLQVIPLKVHQISDPPSCDGHAWVMGMYRGVRDKPLRFGECLWPQHSPASPDSCISSVNWNSTLSGFFWGLNDLMYKTRLSQSLTHNRHSKQGSWSY